ncbi:hypothetical protein F5X99DRAFT_432397 [Biscogniauxia marginata]|nr:hypothetical protein F5X99DRAFT_432397 [Biscogniauxia marginata]
MTGKHGKRRLLLHLYLTVGQDKCTLTSGDGLDTSCTSAQSDQAPTHGHENAGTFLVCSKALARASRAWKRLLYGGFLESKPADGTQWKVHLPGDKPEPIATILNIIHYRFEHVPDKSSITLQSLYEITVVADKYDLTHMLRPWCDGWVTALALALALARKDLGKLSYDHVEQCFWISWVLGQDSLFRSTALHIAKTSEMDSEDRLIAPSTATELQKARFSRVLEPNTNGLIKKTRSFMLRWLLQSLREFYEHPPLAVKSWMAGCTDTACINSVVGSLVTSLVEHGLWPIPDPSTYRGSPDKLETLISKLTIHTPHKICSSMFRDFGLHSNGDHTLCMTGMALMHLRTQRRKSGLAKTALTED